MGKFILTYELNGENFENLKRVEHEFNEEHIDDVLMEFEHFLRGCGYYFDGHLDLVEEQKVHFDNFEDRDWIWDENHIDDSQYECDFGRDDDRYVKVNVSDDWKWTVNEIAKHAKNAE